MQSAGAILTTSESVIFQFVGDAKHPRFKDVQSLVMKLGPDAGLLEM